jgi:hypothetical protein
VRPGPARVSHEAAQRIAGRDDEIIGAVRDRSSLGSGRSLVTSAGGKHPMTSRTLRHLSAAIVLLGAAACNTTLNYPTAVLRPAQDAPERFVRADSSAISGNPGTAACTSPIVDPRSGAQLTMVRAYQGSGDYSVPAGSYGVAGGELLRVDCANGQPVGIVRG